MSNQMPMNVIGNEMTVNALIHLCGENYRKVALGVMANEIEEVLIPVEPTQEMLEFLEDVTQLKTILTSSNEGNEPVYARVEDFLAGRNADGSLHKGYVVVNVLSKLVVALRDREGNNVTSNRNDILTIAFHALSEFRVPDEKDFELIDPNEIGKVFCSLFDGPNGTMSHDRAQWVCDKVNAFHGVAYMEVGDFLTLYRGFHKGFYLTSNFQKKEVQLSAPSREPFCFLG